MSDQSHLDSKYFIDDKVYNCPFCNRRHVRYGWKRYSSFDWSNQKECHVYLIGCHSCGKVSMHLSFEDLREWWPDRAGPMEKFRNDPVLDAHILYSVPNSFFVLDQRIPRTLRDLITEAEGCLKMNFLTGASACTRKTIYELLIIEAAEGEQYDERVKSLKKKRPNVDPALFDVLGAIHGMTSDKIHEQSWPEWDNQHLRVLLETLRAILVEMYVVPEEAKSRIEKVKKLQSAIVGSRQSERTAAKEPDPSQSFSARLAKAPRK